MRHPDDKPTIGLLLVKEKNCTVVEYSLEGYKNPIGVADWGNEFNTMDDEVIASLPSVEEIENEMNQINISTEDEDYSD